jgi:nicotinate dehydrogenase subunit B
MSEVTVESPSMPASVARNPRLDEWIRLDSDGTVRVFTGKAELGQGILTALCQIVAEELDVAISAIRILSANTSQGPDEQYTYGSQSTEQSRTALRFAGAQARALILEAAARVFGLPQCTLKADDGEVIAPDGRRLRYWDAIGDDTALFARDVTLSVNPKPSNMLRIVGRSAPRIDLPAKLTGEASFIADLRLPRMVFGRVVRPIHMGAKLLSIDTFSVLAMAGAIAVVQDGSFLGVVAEREEHAISARIALAAAARWNGDGGTLPDFERLTDALRNLAPETTVPIDDASASVSVGKRIEAENSRPYLSQGSIGPPWRDGSVRRWSPNHLVAHAGRVSAVRRRREGPRDEAERGRCHARAVSRLLRPERSR